MKKHTFLRQRVFHDGLSMIVAKKDEAHPVPADLLADFIADKSIAGPDAKATKVEAEEPSPFQSTHKGGGRYQISGPGLDEPELVTGKDAMEARVDELTKAHAAAAADNEGAPNE